MMLVFRGLAQNSSSLVSGLNAHHWLEHIFLF